MAFQPIPLSEKPTEQEIFDKAVAHLAGMPRRCSLSNNSCDYRNHRDPAHATSACVVGAFLPERAVRINEYGDLFFGPVTSLAAAKRLGRLQPFVDLLTDLQSVAHDELSNWTSRTGPADPVEMGDALRRVACLNDCDATVVDRYFPVPSRESHQEASHG